MSSRFTKKSFVSVSGTIREDAMLRMTEVRVQYTHSPDEGRHLRCAQRQELCTIDEQLPRPRRLAPSEVVAEAVRVGSSTSNDSASVCSADASVRPGVNGTSSRGRRSSPPARRRRSRRGRSGPPGRPSLRRAGSLEVGPDPSSVCQDPRELRRLVRPPSPSAARGECAPRSPTTLVGAAEGGRRGPGRVDQSRIDSPESRILPLRSAMSRASISS